MMDGPELVSPASTAALQSCLLSKPRSQPAYHPRLNYPICLSLFAFVFLMIQIRSIHHHHHHDRRRHHHQRRVNDLVDLLLLVDAELARAAVDEQKKATNDGEDLEEVVLGEVLVGVVLMELRGRRC
jgi:hypothetical protein